MGGIVPLRRQTLTGMTLDAMRARSEHRAILAAVRKRDVVKAPTLMRAHILEAGRSFVSFLEAHRGAQPPRVRSGAKVTTS